MGLLRAAKKAIRSRQEKQTRVKQIGDDSTTREPENNNSSSKPSETRPGRRPRAAWGGGRAHSGRANTGRALTPVSEGEETPDTQPDDSVMGEPADVSLGLGGGGGGTQKRRQIYIDMRGLTGAIDTEEEEEDGQEESSGKGSNKHHGTDKGKFRAIYDSRGYFTKSGQPEPSLSRSRRLCEQQRLQSSRRLTLAATEPRQPIEVTPTADMTARSAMDILDSIIQSEQKLDKPYLTRANVDTSLPGSTEVQQKTAGLDKSSINRRGSDSSESGYTGSCSSANTAKYTLSASDCAGMYTASAVLTYKVDGQNPKAEQATGDISRKTRSRGPTPANELSKPVFTLERATPDNLEQPARQSRQPACQHKNKKANQRAKNGESGGSNFFSCHEKALREAGYHVKELSRAAENVRVSSGSGRRKTTLTYDPASDVFRGTPHAPPSSSSTNTSRLRTKIRIVSSFLTKIKRRSDLDVRPLVNYLQLVKARPDEYLSLREAGSNMDTDSASSDPLSQLGRAYRDREPRDLVFWALDELGSKTWQQHPALARYEAATQRAAEITASSSTRKPFRKSELSSSPANARRADQDPIPALTDMEKARGEVESWLSQLTTAQYLRAKDLALTEIGEGEREGGVTGQSWVRNRACRYLRDKRAESDMA